MTEERKNELQWLWENETNDPETEEWRDELDADEMMFVEKLDEQYERGLGKLLNDWERMQNGGEA
ncbi:MAG: hypothetical protein KBS74_06720 [Clostridiales bacterium]|nr:hypothetical protein [Candidatus Cacconaster stercorequi]